MNVYDLAIVGGGPAGVAAGVYASRKRLKTVFITKDWGGQSLVSPEIQNWIGTIKVSGFDLGEMLKKHLQAYAADIVGIVEGEVVVKVEKSPLSKGGEPNADAAGVVSPLIKGVSPTFSEKWGTGVVFTIRTESEKVFEAKTILITAGSHRRKLTVPNADRFEHNGITYCASCDGPLFAGLPVAVVGGGNAGFETAAQLLAYCKSVTLLHRGDEFKADLVTVKKVLANPKMHAILNAEILSVEGERSVTGLVYRTKEKPEKQTLPVQGIFVEIGSVPSTEFVKGLIELDKYGQIVVDPRNQRARLLTPPEIVSDARRGESDAGGVGSATTSATQRLRNEADEMISGGVWAAGDVTDGLYHQNNIAAGDAVKALEDIYLYIHANK